MTDSLFQTKDDITSRAVDSYKKSREILRGMKECDIEGEPKYDSEECAKAKGEILIDYKFIYIIERSELFLDRPGQSSIQFSKIWIVSKKVDPIFKR